MNICLDDLDISFPFPTVYPEQLNFMREFQMALKTGDHTIISTYKAETKGYTVALLSLLVGYVGSKHGESKQILYCTKDAERANKVMETLKLVHNHRCIVLRDENPSILAVGFSSRKELCIHSDVIERSDQDEDRMVGGCRELTASWVREVDIEDVCSFFDKAEGSVLSPGIYGISDLVDTGKENGWCPYFVTKHALQTANIVVFGYSHILDPKLAGIISKELKRDSSSILIFDNADDIDKWCREPLSINIFSDTVLRAEQNIKSLLQELERVSGEDRLLQEYQRLIDGVKDEISPTDQWLANPALAENLMGEKMPEEICLPENFLHHLNRLVSYLDFNIKLIDQKTHTPIDFLTGFNGHNTSLNSNYFKFFDERLNTLIRTLKIENIDSFISIKKICHFATIWGTYMEDNRFKIETGGYTENFVKLLCTDPSLSFTSVLNRFGPVCITLKEGPANSITTIMNSEALVCRAIIPRRR